LALAAIRKKQCVHVLAAGQVETRDYGEPDKWNVQALHMSDGGGRTIMV